MSIDRAAQLTSLHLFGMATAWSELMAEASRQPVQPEAWLHRLIDAQRLRQGLADLLIASAR